MAEAQDLYEVLGVGRDATAQDIQRAYRKLARTYHPDVNKDPAAERRFQEISEAYEVLSDPESRRRYDVLGPDFRQVPPDVDPETWARAGLAAALGPGAPPPATKMSGSRRGFRASISTSMTFWVGCSEAGGGRPGVAPPGLTRRPRSCSPWRMRTAGGGARSPSPAPAVPAHSK